MKLYAHEQVEFNVCSVAAQPVLEVSYGGNSHVVENQNISGRILRTNELVAFSFKTRSHFN